MIDQLRNITIEDLKKINVDQIKAYAKAKPDILIKIVLIVIALFATIYIYKSYREKLTAITEETERLNNKLKIADTQKIVQKNYDEFMGQFPKVIEKEKLIDKLSEYARENNIQVSSFSPIKETEAEHTKTQALKINITSDNYKDLILFIKSIETAPFSIRVDRWAGQMSPTSKAESGAKSATTVEAEVEISSIKIK